MNRYTYYTIITVKRQYSTLSPQIGQKSIPISPGFTYALFVPTPPSKLRLYNTLTKHEEEFVPRDANEVTMYTCGPTVYGRPHVGNYSSFLMADLLRRWMETQGYLILHAKNITDVGHLVRDRDDGEDKIEKQAREEFGAVSHETVINVARTYEAQYLEDERALNILEPAHRPRATEYIDQMKEMIAELLQKEIAYTTSDGIYFDVTKFPHYGALSGNTIENLSAGARVEVNEEKHHPADFALWKFCVGPNEHHALRWKSPGKKNPDGFPGWHIECSAMSRALLGDTIDIHTGGEDNIFPHHECEIAQTESIINDGLNSRGIPAADGTKKQYKPFVRLWLHKRRIDLEGEKMSKSLGNVLTIPNISERGYDSLDLRYYLLSVHYRTNLKFSWKGMDDAKKARAKIVQWMMEVEHVEAAEECDHEQHESIARLYGGFRDAMNSDLNTPGALGAIFDMMSWQRNAGALCMDTKADLLMAITMIRHTFGCFEAQKEEKIPTKVKKLLEERAEARKAKNFAESDRLRDEITKLGFEVRDAGNEQSVKKI